MAETNTILLAILVVGIVGLLGFTVYGYLKENKSITELTADTTNVNKAVVQLASSLDALTKTTGGIDGNLNGFIKTSSDYYKANTDAIAAINKLLLNIQASAFTKQDLTDLVDAVNKRVQAMNKGTFRGYFSPNDTADVITKTLTDIQTQMLKNTETYLLASASMANYIQSIVGKNAPSLADFDKTNSNLNALSDKLDKYNNDLTGKIQAVSDKLDKTISTLDSYVAKWSTLPPGIQAQSSGAVQAVPVTATVPYALFGTGSQLTTPSNDGGNGNTIYLDRHNMDCGNNALNRLRYSRTGTNSFQYQYNCTTGGALGAPVAKATPFNDDGGGNTIYLDRHDADCGPNSVMTQLHLARNSAGNQIQWQYKCAPNTQSAALTCRNVTTQWDDEGGGNSIYLDRHNIACNSNEALSRLHLLRDGKGKYLFEYRCCS